LKPWQIRRVIVIAGLVLASSMLFVLGHQAIVLVERAADLQHLAAQAMLSNPLVLLVLAIYVLLLAIPFVTGAELGLLLLVLFGADIAPVVYVATVMGMNLSFWTGRRVPAHRLAALCRALGAERLAAFVLSPTSARDPVAPGDGVPGFLWRRIARHRHIALALVINTPGNTLVGGGGGISLMAGLSQAYTPLGFLITVLVAVAPLPGTVLVLSYL